MSSIYFVCAFAGGRTLYLKKSYKTFWLSHDFKTWIKTDKKNFNAWRIITDTAGLTKKQMNKLMMIQELQK